MAYLQELKRKSGVKYRMYWRSRDPKSGELKLRSKLYAGSGGKEGALKEARLEEAKDTSRPLTTEGDGTYRTYFEIWASSAKVGVQASTSYNIDWAIARLNAYIGDQKLKTLSPLTFVNIVRLATADGLEPVTVRKLIRTFKKSMRSAITYQLLPAEASITIDGAEPVRVPKKTVVLRSIAETEILAEFIRPKYPAPAGILIVAAYTGMRYGEIAALDYSQLDPLRNTITVDRTLAKGKDGYTVNMNPKTDAGRRVIPMSPEVREILAPDNRPQSGQVFRNRNGDFIQPASASVPVMKAAQELGLPQGFHCSRHFFASLLLSKNIPLPRISRILGHSSVRVTMETYAHLIPDPDGDRAILEALSDATPKVVSGELAASIENSGNIGKLRATAQS